MRFSPHATSLLHDYGQFIFPAVSQHHNHSDVNNKRTFVFSLLEEFFEKPSDYQFRGSRSESVPMTSCTTEISPGVVCDTYRNVSRQFFI